MTRHWRGFTYNGSFPPDRDAKNLSMAVRPLALRDWFGKPASMHKGTHTDVGSAYGWLEAELREVYPDPARLPSALAYYRMHLDLGQDAYVSHSVQAGPVSGSAHC